MKFFRDMKSEVKGGAKFNFDASNKWKRKVEIREEIKEKLDKTKIKYEQKIVPKSSFEGLEIVESSTSVLRIIFKTKGGGSGLGAEGTTIVESAHAVYAARLAFGLGRHITNADITPANVKSYKKFFSVDGKIDEILNKLADVWITSSILGANELWESNLNQLRLE